MDFLPDLEENKKSGPVRLAPQSQESTHRYNPGLAPPKRTAATAFSARHHHATPGNTTLPGDSSSTGTRKGPRCSAVAVPAVSAKASVLLGQCAWFCRSHHRQITCENIAFVLLSPRDPRLLQAEITQDCLRRRTTE